MTTPSGYNNIAVASTFSPRFHQVLAEAKRISRQFGSNLSLIYVGEREAETEKRFSEMLRQLELRADSIIHYAKGDPATAILQTIHDQKIDMIVAGALEKEVILH